MFAQLSKQETKQWKKSKKAMSVEDYKNMVDENTTFQQQNNQMSAELSASQSDLQQKQEEVAILQVKVQNLDRKSVV